MPDCRRARQSSIVIRKIGGVLAYFKGQKNASYDFPALTIMNLSTASSGRRARISIGIIAWNEERAIGPMLQSLFGQTLFAELARRRQRCEIVCIANGCTDSTAALAREIFSAQAESHPHAESFTARVAEIRERGKINAWNLFVHSLSAGEADYLCLMDADIVIRHPETLWNMVLTLENRAEANVSVDCPRKDIEFKPAKRWRDRISLAMTELTRSSRAQMCGQLYCIRAAVARNIYLPRHLTACDDGFIKALVCTDFLAHPPWPMRIQTAKGAEHTFEAYTSSRSVIRNQKRQIIGQTIVHLLVDRYLPGLPPLQRSKLADTLKRLEQEDPDWLKRLIRQHVQGARFFWQLYPGLLTHRFKRLSELGFGQAMVRLPAVLAGWVFTVCGGVAAFKALRDGRTGYWPRADRSRFRLSLEGEVPLAPLKHSER